MHRPFRSLAGIPVVEIPAKDKKLAADLNDRNVIFFNDSAEMPNRESSEFGGCRDVQKHFGAGLSGGCRFRLHRASSGMHSHRSGGARVFGYLDSFAGPLRDAIRYAGS